MNIANEISDHLVLRDSAAAFFDKIEGMPEESVVVDFRGVVWMSRAFAHEYFTRKSASTKKIDEDNVPDEVRKMLAVVADPSHRRRSLEGETTAPTGGSP